MVRNNLNTLISSLNSVFFFQRIVVILNSFQGSIFFTHSELLVQSFSYITLLTSPCWRKFPLTNAVSLVCMYIYVTLVVLFLLRQTQWHYFLNWTLLPPLILNPHSQRAKCTHISQAFSSGSLSGCPSKLCPDWGVYWRVLNLPGKQHCHALLQRKQDNCSLHTGVHFLSINDPERG